MFDKFLRLAKISSLVGIAAATAHTVNKPSRSRLHENTKFFAQRKKDRLDFYAKHPLILNSFESDDITKLVEFLNKEPKNILSYRIKKNRSLGEVTRVDFTSTRQKNDFVDFLREFKRELHNKDIKIDQQVPQLGIK